MSRRNAILPPLSALAAAVLAGAPVSAQAGGSCSVPEAEAEVCPSFELAPEGVYWIAISADGSTRVGGVIDGSVLIDGYASHALPARWVDGMLEMLTPLPPGARWGGALGVSSDGSVVVGGLALSEPYGDMRAAFRWEDGVYEILDAPDAFANCGALAVSADARVVLGWEVTSPDTTPIGERILVWDERGVTVLGESPEYAYALSGDGSVIVGQSSSEPVVWAGGAQVELPLSGGATTGQARAVTPDGAVVVGGVGPGGAARWQSGSVELLGLSYPGGTFTGSQARAVSADGRVVVGGAINPIGPFEEMFHWSESGGTRRLLDLLELDLGLDVQGYEPRVATNGVSLDAAGRRVLGHAAPAGEIWPFRSFAADLSPPVGVDIAPGSADNAIDVAYQPFVTVRVFGSARLDVEQVDVGSLGLGPDGAAVAHVFGAADANGDGWPDRDFRFRVAETGLAPGDSEACLAGLALGLPFEVCGPVLAIVSVPEPGRAAQLATTLALALSAAWWRRRRADAASRGARG